MNPPPPSDLLALPPDELQAELVAHFQARGEPAYRARQVARWLHHTSVSGFADMTDLPADERGGLAAAYVIGEPTPETVSVSSDGTVKHLWRLADGELVESVLIPAVGRLTLCLSSQAGCAMGCTFCATGWGGFRRQLGAGEIVGQYRASLRYAATHALGPITNVVYMGMGEPLANRRALNSSLTVLNRGFGLGARRITVSTVGVVPGIRELARRPEQFRLALSLHAPDTELRRELIPLEDRWPLPDVLDALREFNAAGGRRITFEYIMIQGVNDDIQLAVPLAIIARDLKAFVNLIPFNPIPWQDWGPSPPARIRRFAEILGERGVEVAVREPRGRDIDAACGQLRARVRADTPARGRTRGLAEVE